MGDRRFDAAYERLSAASDRAGVLATMSDAEVIFALASASRAQDPYLANVLATEALNRQRRAAAKGAAITLGFASVLVLVSLGLAFFALSPHNWPDEVIFLVEAVILGLSSIGARFLYSWRAGRHDGDEEATPVRPRAQG